MKIAIVGYGKMGKIIDRIAQERGHEVVCRLSETPTPENLNGAEVAIEFSQPEVAFENIHSLLKAKVPVVCGTTGWLDRKQEIEEIALNEGTSFLYGSNFSLGVNLFFALNAKLAQLMTPFEEYKLQLDEIHHLEKKDAPSGTAISIAEGIIANTTRYDSWVLGESQQNQIGIIAKREDGVPGTHSVYYTSEVDEIEIKHTAFNRNGFALGAVIASEWIIDKKGIFTMQDVLGL